MTEQTDQQLSAVSLTSAKLNPKERALEALRMRRRGEHYENIRKALGYGSLGGVERAIKRAMIAEAPTRDKEEARAVDIGRTDELYRFIYPRLRKGEPRAIEVGVRILERRARMFGYDEVDQPKELPRTAPVVINYMPHESDQDAVAFVERLRNNSLPAHSDNGNGRGASEEILESSTEGFALDEE